MSYSALYRRLRPKNFSEIVGQEHIVKTLSNQIASGRVSHAYLFCGTRGTGKTSVAKIFSRAINCESPAGGDMCGECSICRRPPEDMSMVVFEADAASNNGVDNIRDLRGEVGFLPPFGKYKVYIIDEVHMLSAGAFNALLKTLEEPPAHVVFILATTEPQKIPATIHSRCQRFDFRRIPTAEIAAAMAGYMAADGIEVPRDALLFIARAAGGSMRDALSILDRCLSYYQGEALTLEKVRETLGASDGGVLFELADALREKNAGRVMALIDGVVSMGRDTAYFVEEMLGHFRDLMICAAIPEGAGDNPALDLPEDELAKKRAQAKKIGFAAIMEYVEAFSALHPRIKTSANQRIMLEMACMRLCGEGVTNRT